MRDRQDKRVNSRRTEINIENAANPLRSTESMNTLFGKSASAQPEEDVSRATVERVITTTGKPLLADAFIKTDGLN